LSGAEAALAELHHMNLPANHFYFTLLGELYKHSDVSKARKNFEKAIELARNEADKAILKNKIQLL
jgi:predicted RNA polymerase sigma factor